MSSQLWDELDAAEETNLVAQSTSKSSGNPSCSSSHSDDGMSPLKRKRDEEEQNPESVPNPVYKSWQEAVQAALADRIAFCGAQKHPFVMHHGCVGTGAPSLGLKARAFVHSHGE
eukprot:6465358-Amphidinium_carterae.1